MKEIYDDSQFHDMTLEEFQKLIEESSEVDIPLDSFQDFVNEVNYIDEAAYWDTNNYLSYAEECLCKAEYKEAFSVAHQYSKAVHQTQQARLREIYDACSEHGILDASIIMADYYFERWESSDEYRGKAYKYLRRVHKAGYLPYFWKYGYCYLNGIGVLPSKLQAKCIFMDGMLCGGDDMCAGYLKYLVPEVENALEDATTLFFDTSKEHNYRKAYELYINAAIHAGWNSDRGYPIMRIADIQMQKNIDDSITPRKCFLMYKTALKLGVWGYPEQDSDFDESELYYKLGEMYFDGYGTKKDYYRAAQYLSCGWLPAFDEDEKALAKREKYINEAWEKAELLSNDDADWKYYRECFKRGEMDIYEEDGDPEDNFLYLY